jgi:hypothetical protein
MLERHWTCLSSWRAGHLLRWRILFFLLALCGAMQYVLLRTMVGLRFPGDSTSKAPSSRWRKLCVCFVSTERFHYLLPTLQSFFRHVDLEGLDVTILLLDDVPTPDSVFVRLLAKHYNFDSVIYGGGVGIAGLIHRMGLITSGSMKRTFWLRAM